MMLYGGQLTISSSLRLVSSWFKIGKFFLNLDKSLTHTRLHLFRDKFMFVGLCLCVCVFEWFYANPLQISGCSDSGGGKLRMKRGPNEWLK